LLKNNYDKKTHLYQGCVPLGSTVCGWLDFFVFYWENPFLVTLVDQLFQPASNQVETVEKAFARLCRKIVARLRTSRRNYCVSTEKGWQEKCFSSRNVDRINPNRLGLKRLIPAEHDLSFVIYISSLSRLVLFACLLQQVPVLFCFAVCWVFS